MSTQTLLFEIGTEELPSWYVTQAANELKSLIQDKLHQAQLEFGEVRVFATPRRVAVLVADVAERSLVRTERRRGPAVSVAFDADGQPTRAALGFAASSGVDASALQREVTDKGEYVFVSREVGGELARDVLPALLADSVKGLPAPRKMRWGAIETPFVRPVAWLVALLGETVLPVEVAGVTASNVTYGHRFLAPEAKTVTVDTYLDVLKDAFVIADIEERNNLMWQQVEQVAAEQGLTPMENQELRDEVTNLVEHPFAVMGHFDSTYLELPEEVLTTVMIHHQRYIPLRAKNGQLAAHFVSISNNKVPDESVIRAGYEQVLNGRLYDAKFFWDQDKRKSLSQHAWGLSGIGFQKELGSMADKITRVEESARNIADLLGLSEDERATLDKALPIFRADLSTEMVYELPELEGVMARAYALAEGYPPEVANALEYGVLPKGPLDALPASRVGAVLAVADRLDKLVGFFAIGKRPSGSADPFGLRRDANAVARTLNAQGWSVGLAELVEAAVEAYSAEVKAGSDVVRDVTGFIWDRVASLLSDEGIRIELVRAAVADEPPVIRTSRRCHLLQTISAEAEFSDLMALYKRVANLANQADAKTKVNEKRLKDPYAIALYNALPSARTAVENLMTTARRVLVPWDLGRGPSQPLAGLEDDVASLLAIKEPLDAFMDNVLVMVDDEAIKGNRLALLKEVRDVMRTLGHMEELEGL